MLMWYYINDGTQQGPLDDAGIDGLLARRAITPETLVWKEGLAEWMPLSSARPLTALADPAGICNVCGAVVGADNLVDLVGSKVCAACKPKAVQALREGTALSTNTGTWRSGNRVVVQDNEYLPQRCLKCNQATSEPPLKRKLYWHPPLYYILVVISVLLYIIVAVIIRKKAVVHAYLCADHLRRRKYFMIGGWVGALAGLVMIFTGAAVTKYGGVLLLAGFAMIVAAIIAGIAGATVMRATRINKEKTVWLKGAGKDFLASLPDWTGSEN
jgi:hypothetical protein